MLVICDSCGTMLKRSPSQVHKCKYHFCDRKCSGKYHRVRTAQLGGVAVT